VAILEAADGVVVESVPGTFWEYVGLNCKREPLNDPNVRRAIAWAVDRQMVNQLIKFGQATVLDGGHIPPNHWAHADLATYPKRDVAKAKQLLADAGYPDGFSVTMKVGSAFAYQVQAGEVVKQHLADVGINVHLQGLESAVFFDALGQHDFDMTLVGWVGFVDPDEWMWNLFHSQGKWNQQQYENAELDKLLDAGRTTLDRAERKEIYRRAQEIVVNDAPMVFLYVNDQTSAWRRRVHGYRVHPTANTRSLRDTWVAR